MPNTPVLAGPASTPDVSQRTHAESFRPEPRLPRCPKLSHVPARQAQKLPSQDQEGKGRWETPNFAVPLWDAIKLSRICCSSTTSCPHAPHLFSINTSILLSSTQARHQYSISSPCSIFPTTLPILRSPPTGALLISSASENHHSCACRGTIGERLSDSLPANHLQCVRAASRHRLGDNINVTQNLKLQAISFSSRIHHSIKSI